MLKQIKFSFLYISLSLSFFDVGLSSAENPFTAKAFLIRYWDNKISNKLPKPAFLISKASPLTALDLAKLTKLADSNSLSSNLPSFCSSANLFCFSDISQKHDKDVDFKKYSNENFTNYGTMGHFGVDSFANYSDNKNMPVNSFRQYSRTSSVRDEKFTSYSTNGNVADDTFNTYGPKTVAGAGEFNNYDTNVNVLHSHFTSYTADAVSREQKFTSYSQNANAGDEDFRSYGKNGNNVSNVFTSYGKSSNVIGSTFTGYGEGENGGHDKFTSYGFDTNNPQNNFRNYGEQSLARTEDFTTYRDLANVGDDKFTSYGKNSNAAKVNFLNYGKPKTGGSGFNYGTSNEGTDVFTGYGGSVTGFKIYGPNNTFADYIPNSATFAKYSNMTTASKTESGKTVNRWVEPGKFFREAMLKEGTVMPFPDIKDKMPKRSFLPRSISSKLPFTTSHLWELKQIFHARENSTMETVLTDTLLECERRPSMGETKSCVKSIEDMIDFAISVLGNDIVVRTTDNLKGSKKDIMIGMVKGINGGKVTKSVSCHQSLFPSLVYYCHSVPKVRVYEAEILDVKSKAKINKGTAICHVDTSSWSATHGAFVALGSKPGLIEVCHWIFENDMTWATSDPIP
ncbi:hypothetical protein GIB67_004304 [Kingdonia uniflora]|uniref:BURP domain-containing protein n=1 Tax=Kingdonia uniflora TaxID=39325 RepID=A0A7J7MR67_9MAGN|nr:hypothetical protein GIB67_004304 [Kingdonia uniflora]